MPESYIQEYMEEEEIRIFKTTNQGEFFFIRETSKLLTTPYFTCPSDQPEPMFYRIPSKYPSIELTPTYLCIGLIILTCVFFIGKKTENYRRSEELKRKKLKKKLKKINFQTNDQFLEQRAKYFFRESFPNPCFKEDSNRSNRERSDSLQENKNEKNNDFSNFLENNEQNSKILSENNNFSVVPFKNKTNEEINQINQIKIIKKELNSLEVENKQMIEETFFLNWPLLDSKFNMNVDFAIKIENGVLKSISTNNKISNEAFQALMVLLIEKFYLPPEFPNIKKYMPSIEVLKENNEIMKNSSILPKVDDENKENIKTNDFIIKSMDHLIDQLKKVDKEKSGNALIQFYQPKEDYVFKGKEKLYESIENEKIACEEQEIKEIKHFQFDLFENGRYSKVFNSLQEIGKGAFGEVYKVIHKIENSIYAIKKVYLPLKMNEDFRYHKYFREVMSMSKFNHKNVIRYYTSWIEEPDKNFKDHYITKKKEIVNKKKKKQKKRSNSSNSYSEEQKHEMLANVSNYERTKLSSLGFEWVASDKNLGGIENSYKESPIPKKIGKQNSSSSHNTFSRSVSFSLSKNTEKDKISKKLNKNSENSKISKDYEHWSSIIDKMTVDQIPVVLYIQMHYCSGQSLRNYLDSPQRKIDRYINFQMFNQMIDGIKCIHANGIIHRDLKPANIFIDEDQTIMIGDFGLSVTQHLELKTKATMSLEMEENNSNLDIFKNKTQSLTKNIGTPLYLAPEQEKGQAYDEKVDIYALGLILLEMFTIIKTGHERFNLFNDIRKSHKVPVILRRNYKYEADLILLMTSSNPKDRPTSDKIEKCPEFKAWKDTVLNKIK